MDISGEFGDVHSRIVKGVLEKGFAHGLSSKKNGSFNKGKFLINFGRAITDFESAMHKFPMKKILYRSIFRGKGLEFETYRLHTPMDDASLIDWGASLRANTLLARQYIEERNLNVYFLLDVSNSMLFGSLDKLKAEYAAELVAALSHLVVGSGDNIGLIMFNNNVVKVLHPSSNKNQFALFTKFLSDSNFYGGGFDFNRVIDYVLKTTKSSYSVFILISDFIKMRKDSLKNLRLIGSKFEVFAIIIRDPLDENLPKVKYQFSVQDPYSGKQMILDPEIAFERYRQNVVRQKILLKEMFRKSQIDFLELITNRSFAIPVSSFLKNRAVGGRK